MKGSNGKLKKLKSLSMQNVPCNICETNEYEEKLYPIDSGILVKCNNCGLFYVNPRRTDIINKIAKNQTPDKLYEAKKINLKGRIKQFNHHLKTIHRYKNPPGKILDIGCYEGLFLYEAKKKGWDVTGVEPNIGAANFAQKELNLDVKQCLLKETDFDNQIFDVVTLFACLEHVPDPTEILSNVRTIIKEDGILIITVPTIPFYLPLIKSRWRMFIGGHNYFFTDESMKELLNKNRFKLIYKKYTMKSFDLDTLSYRLSSEWQPYNLGKIGKLIRNFIMKIGISNLRFEVKPRDSKMYIAKPI